MRESFECWSWSWIEEKGWGECGTWESLSEYFKDSYVCCCVLWSVEPANDACVSCALDRVERETHQQQRQTVEDE